MAGQSRKWMILVATIWIQAFTGTNFDFPAYSSALKSVLGISQVQLNCLAVASDLGKVFGWSSGLALKYLPLWVVLFMAGFMGFFGYGLQWLVIMNFISLPYILVFFLCLLAGCSICWFNTVCFVLCIENFPSNRSLALSLTISFNGVSAALYALIGNAVDPLSSEVYPLLNALVPLIVSFAVLSTILRQPEVAPLTPDGNRSDSLVFLLLNLIAVLTGIYLVIFGSSTRDVRTARLLLEVAIFLLVSPICVPGVIYAGRWFHRTVHTSFRLEDSQFDLVDTDDLELHTELISSDASRHGSGQLIKQSEGNENEFCCWVTLGKNRLGMLGQEHPARLLVRRLDFWLYYVTYVCGGTIGLVYSNNLGQVAQSLGHGSKTTTLLTIYSSFSFFGRLLSAAPDYIRTKMYFARTAWLTIALVPTPIALFALALAGNEAAVHIGTALMGLSSGFIFAAAVSITSELFGPNSVGVNHNILISNIPIGSLVYGVLAALVYDAHTKPASSDLHICMGRQCYFLTFIWWGCLSVLGLSCSALLFVRTKHAYSLFERNQVAPQLH